MEYITKKNLHWKERMNMKRTHRGLARLLSAGMSLALLTSLVPGATAASNTLNYKVDSDDILEIKDSDFPDLTWTIFFLRSYPAPGRESFTM